MAGASYADAPSIEETQDQDTGAPGRRSPRMTQEKINEYENAGWTKVTWSVEDAKNDDKEEAEKEEDCDVPPDYFEFFQNPSDEVDNMMKKDQDAEIARFGALTRPDPDNRLGAMFAIVKEKMLKEEEEALVEWNEDNIDVGMVYLPHKSSDPSKEKCLVKLDHPVVAYLNAMGGPWHYRRFSKVDCVKGTDYIKAYATEVRMCLTKIKARLRARDS